MLIVKVNKGKSDIQGEGIFASEQIKKGQPIWFKHPHFDLEIEQREVGEDLREYLDKYSTVSNKKEKVILDGKTNFINLEDIKVYHLDGDDCKYMNHSLEPNIVFNETIGLAARDIDINEELTCNYQTITIAEHFEYLMSLVESTDPVKVVETLENTDFVEVIEETNSVEEKQQDKKFRKFRK